MKFVLGGLLPQIVEGSLSAGLVAEARSAARIQIEYVNVRDFAKAGPHNAVDDRPYGGGDGMLMCPEPLAQTITAMQAHFQKSGTPLFLLGPEGIPFTTALAKKMAAHGEVGLLACRYGGADHRVQKHFGLPVLSVGDFVLSGGELAQALVIDAVSRFVPGVLGHADSAANDSLSGPRLEAPQWTRPAEWRGQVVPAILRSGDHRKIQQWQKMMSAWRTQQLRPDLWREWIAQEPGIELELQSFVTNMDPQERQDLLPENPGRVPQAGGPL